MNLNHSQHGRNCLMIFGRGQPGPPKKVGGARGEATVLLTRFSPKGLSPAQTENFESFIQESY